MNIYDSLDADVLLSYHEYSLASLLYYAMKESSCSELSARMTAMDGASKNAGALQLVSWWYSLLCSMQSSSHPPSYDCAIVLSTTIMSRQPQHSLSCDNTATHLNVTALSLTVM